MYKTKKDEHLIHTTSLVLDDAKNCALLTFFVFLFSKYSDQFDLIVRFLPILTFKGKNH